MKTTRLVDLRFFATNSRLQNGLSMASCGLFGPAVMLLTVLTPSTASISRVSFWIRLKYAGDRMFEVDTARINSGRDGKVSSSFVDCFTCGSLAEKKKFWSTTGLRSTRVMR